MRRKSSLAQDSVSTSTRRCASSVSVLLDATDQKIVNTPQCFKGKVGEFMRLLFNPCSHLSISSNGIHPSDRERTFWSVWSHFPIFIRHTIAGRILYPTTMGDVWDLVYMPGESAHASASASPHTSGDDANSQDESPVEVPVNNSPPRKRKPHSTYYARKEEVKELRQESAELSRIRDQLRERQRLRYLPLKQTLSLNASLLSQLEHSRRTIAATQLLVGPTGTEHTKQLLGSYIHLPADPAARKQVLVDMKPKKIQEALDYLLMRSQFLDLRLPTRQIENCVSEDGNHLTYHWEISKFKGKSLSVEQIFHDMIYFVRHQEMEMAEKMGILHIRESDVADDVIDATQVRIISAGRVGFMDEKNIALHTQYSHGSARLGQPHGVFSVDSVDMDDAFPYQPETRVRKDVAVAVLVVECPRRHPDEPTTVAMVRWAQQKVHNSRLATFEELDALSRDNIAAYLDSMTRVIRERIVWRQNNFMDASIK